MRKNKPMILTVDRQVFHIGDIVRHTGGGGGNNLIVTGVRGGEVREWRKIPLHRSVWNWVRRRGWQRREPAAFYPTAIRAYKYSPTGLPRRLP